ncbi:hypothetical protein AMECASPLE_013686 [Ameca splendens]|uniref:Uncharacterized protein n=1 Tax=Ameca splendens TaxID=208324 RepID=A0ABV0ZNU3_9TELE
MLKLSKHVNQSVLSSFSSLRLNTSLCRGMFKTLNGQVVQQKRNNKIMSPHEECYVTPAHLSHCGNTTINRLQTSCSTSATHRLGRCHLFAHKILYVYVRRQTSARITSSLLQHFIYY